MADWNETLSALPVEVVGGEARYEALHIALPDEVDAEVVAAISAALAALSGAPRLGPRARLPSARGARLDALRDRLDPHGPVRLALEGDDLVVSALARGWVTSHDVGEVPREVARLPLAALSADRDDAAALVDALTRVALAHLPAPTPARTCRLCGGTIAALDFDPELGACHACAADRLGVRY